MESIDRIKESLDSISLKYEPNNHLSIDPTSIKELLHSIVHSEGNDFSEPNLINHRSFLILRDWYLSLFQRWRRDEQFDETSSFIFQTIPILFLQMSRHVSDQNISIVKQLILDESILNEINICLEEILSTGKYFQDSRIKSLDGLLRAIQRLEKSQFDISPDRLFDKVVDCVCSASFIEIIFNYSTGRENDNVDAGQSFFLNTCIDYVYFHSIDQQHRQTLLQIRQSLIRPFSQWLVEKSRSFRLWNNRMTIILRQLCSVLTLSIQRDRHANLEEDIFNYFCQIIDSLVNILYSICDFGYLIDKKLTHSLITTITLSLCTMTLSNRLRKYLKSKHIVTLFLKLENITDQEAIRLNVCRILSIIVTERDAKTLSNIVAIVRLFVTLLNQMIDDSSQCLRFHHLLRCLQKLISSDPIKNELTEQNALSLLLRCAMETNFRPLQGQQAALEILLALTFNKQANRQLKENFIAIKALLSSPHPGVSRVADTLLWRLETCEEILSNPKQSERACEYHIMISYSYSDRDFIDRIYEKLIRENVRVWIDRNEPYGISMTTKANIIDRSQYILICLSDEYERNSYCRCEADYINERQCQMIPLVSTLNYHPDGWLVELIRERRYVDFSRADFDTAYRKLKARMNCFR